MGKEEKRMEEKKKRKEERRQKELKAAARFSLKHDSDGEGAPVDFKDFGKRLVKRVSDSESDSDGEREKRREREREERRQKTEILSRHQAHQNPGCHNRTRRSAFLC